MVGVLIGGNQNGAKRGVQLGGECSLHHRRSVICGRAIALDANPEGQSETQIRSYTTPLVEMLRLEYHGICWQIIPSRGCQMGRQPFPTLFPRHGVFRHRRAPISSMRQALKY